MAIAYRGSNVATAGPPFVPTEDGASATGDFMVAFGNLNTVDGVWTLPADFTQIDQISATAGAPDSRVFLAYKVRGADAGSGYSFGYSGTDASAFVALFSFSGTNLGLDVTYAQGTHYHEYTSATNNLNVAAAAITTNTDGAVVILCEALNSGAPITPGGPTGYTQRAASGGTSNGYVYSKAITSAGTETPGVFTHSTEDVTGDQRTFTIAIAELAAAATSKLAVLKRIRHF